MTDQKIEWIRGLEPPRENEFPIFLRVGEHDVTRIEYYEHNYGDHGLGWYRIWRGDDLHCEVAARTVAEVRYFAEPSS